MNKDQKFYNLLLCFMTVMSLLFLSCCKENMNSNQLATPEHPQISPSGKYLLQVINSFESGLNCEKFQILEITKQHRIIFKSKDCFRTRDTLFFLWDNDDRVWVYSGDVGTFFWVDEDGQWVKHTYVQENVSAPDFLKRTRPEDHPK